MRKLMCISVVQKHIADQRVCFISPQNRTNPSCNFQGSIHHLCLYSAVCVNVGFANDEGDILGYVTTKPELPSHRGMHMGVDTGAAGDAIRCRTNKCYLSKQKK